MGSNVLPTDDEVLGLVLGVGSITWRRAGDIRATAGGVRDRDLPATAGEFDDYFDAMVTDVLGNTHAARDVIEALGRPSTPPPAPVG